VRIALVLVIGCTAPPTRPVTNQPTAHAPTAEPMRQFRQLATGDKLGHAKRTTFQLAFDGDLATLVETEERAEGGLSLADADRATWTVRTTRTYRGIRKVVAGGIQLDLATEDMQPLHLQCAPKTVQVAAIGAHRATKCDALDPPGTAPADALVCTAAGQPTDDVDDDDRLVFAPAPGIELASQHDDCTLQGLRRAR
jgi:hypothetical protein